MQVLLLNAGSSSLKCTLMDSATSSVIGRASADWAGSVTRYERSVQASKRISQQVSWSGHREALRASLRDLSTLKDTGSVAAVGHRMVHGGEFSASVRVTPDVRARIAALEELAPLHNPPGLDTLAAAEAALPEVP